MTNSASGQTTRSVVSSGRSLAALVALALLAGTATAGCSDSESGGLDEYTGTWAITAASSNFTLTCPTTIAEGGTLPFPLWTQLTLQEGTISDLAEIGGVCPTYYDVTGTGIATLVSPDPFTGMAPSCLVDALGDASLYLDFRYQAWKITLQAPVKGQAPHGQMVGTASVPVFSVDVNGDLVPDDRGDCSYSVLADLVKIGKE